MSEDDDTLELGEPDKLPKKILLYGGARQGGKAQAAVNQAYEKGRADMRKEMLSGEPDGYCAQSRDGDWMLATCCYDRHHALSVLEDQMDASGKESEDEGWQVKPVKLVEASGDE